MFESARAEVAPSILDRKTMEWWQELTGEEVVEAAVRKVRADEHLVPGPAAETQLPRRETRFRCWALSSST